MTSPVKHRTVIACIDYVHLYSDIGRPRNYSVITCCHLENKGAIDVDHITSKKIDTIDGIVNPERKNEPEM